MYLILQCFFMFFLSETTFNTFKILNWDLLPAAWCFCQQKSKDSFLQAFMAKNYLYVIYFCHFENIHERYETYTFLQIKRKRMFTPGQFVRQRMLEASVQPLQRVSMLYNVLHIMFYSKMTVVMQGHEIPNVIRIL